MIRGGTWRVSVGMGSTHPPVGAVYLLLAAIAALLVGCGSSDGAADSSSAGSASGVAKTVTIKDYLYKPASITVPKGTTVTFANRDSTPHTATSKQSGVFESGSIHTGKSAAVTLEESGSFAYYCLFHPFMKGTIVVN
jgi:plastocyanin